jgi:enediyne biosynthesis protein E4
LLLSPWLGAQAIYVDNSQNTGLTGVHAAAPGHPSVMMVGGGTIGDFNSDGWPDVYMPSGGLVPDYLYINDGDGTFTESGAAWGLTDLHFGVGSAVGDFDNDGWQDLYVCSFGPAGAAGKGHNKLYRNNGHGGFTDVALAAGVNDPSEGNNCYGAAFGDYDEDGDLDLFVTAYSFGNRGNTLYRNEGDGTFSDVTTAVGILDIRTTHGFVPNFVDLNQDGYVDILLIADTGTSKYFQNNGDATFTEANTAIPDLRLPNAMGQATGDFDNDLDLDFYVSDIYYPSSGIGGNRLFVNDGTGTNWVERAPTAGVKAAGWAWGVVATDMDNDGWQDLASTNGWFGSWEGYPSRLFHNQGNGSFQEVAGICGLSHYGQGRSMLRLDADRDGDEDLIVTESNGPISFFQNETNNGNHWLRLSFDTSAVAGLAPHGIGTEVYLRSGTRQVYRQLDSCQSYLGQSELSLHVGLGSLDRIDEVEVHWADGRVSIFPQVAVDQHLVIRASKPVLSAAPIQTMADATFTLSGLIPNSLGVTVLSGAGPGPTVTPYGLLAASEPFNLMRIRANSQGVATRSNYVPSRLSGRTFYLHGFDTVSNSFSNPLVVQVP